MKVFDANITNQVSRLLNKIFKNITSYQIANSEIFEVFRIKELFINQEEYDFLLQKISIIQTTVGEQDRPEYGDFQTNQVLANSIATFLKKQKINPKIIIEPTCGKGSFVLAALEVFPSAEKIICVEIYKPYVWETKFSVIQFYIDNPLEKKPVIEVNHFNVFDFDFENIAKENQKKEILIIGNPPWVTNSKLSSLESTNLPKKSNFKNHNGFDAMTGKGNFDIGEYITLMMFDAFQNTKGTFAFLVKNTVIKNVIYDQKQRNYNISDLQKFKIDSKKEFAVSVDASLFLCKLNKKPDFTCTEFDFYNHEKSFNQFGWVNGKFVSSMELYLDSNEIDGICPFEWRQGIKHDLSSIMELEKTSNGFINGLNQNVKLEDDLVYGFLKSSDLKSQVIDQARKYTIVTQKKIGQDTTFIKKRYPNIHSYLHENKTLFANRKSSIYSNKPEYSIFGVGDYSFFPFKIAISGLYKTFSFSLVMPHEGKPIMLDDTCYFIGFNDIESATYTLILLNSQTTKAFLQAITFSDAKRTFTKSVLMRIDLLKLVSKLSKKEIQKELKQLNERFNFKITIDKWEKYLETIKNSSNSEHESLF